MSPLAAPGVDAPGPPPPWITDGGRDAPMPHPLRYSSLLIVLHAFVLPARSEEARPRPTTRNVVLVTTDGLRWQEVFRRRRRGAAEQEGRRGRRLGRPPPEFWRETPEARREALLPFLWWTVARRGPGLRQPRQGSLARVTNGKNFSYPGYNELLTGSPDPRIDSNDKRPNPNVTVLEWLHAQARLPGQGGRVRVVGRVPVHPQRRAQRPPGQRRVDAARRDSPTESQALLNRLMADTAPDSGEQPPRRPHVPGRPGAPAPRHAPRAVRRLRRDRRVRARRPLRPVPARRPRRFDAALASSGTSCRRIPQYRGTTTLIVTTDHGRGEAPQGWRSHGEKVEGSEAIWIAVLGPDTPALGERSETAGRDPDPGRRHARRPARRGLQRRSTPGRPPDRGPRPAPGRRYRRTPARPLRRIAFGSCASQDRPQPIWDAVAATRPELFLMLGDNIYADTQDMDVMRAKYAQLAAMPGYQKLPSACRSWPPGTTTTSASTTAAPTTRRRSSRSGSSSTSSATPRTRRGASGRASTTPRSSAPRASGSRSSCSTPATSAARSRRRRP